MDIDKIIDKVNDLMALASDPAASDNEASLAYERAQRLIDRYRLEDWRRDRTRRVMTERSVPLAARGWNTFQLELAGIVARANGCRVYGSYDYSAATGRRGRLNAHFVGEARDADTAVMLFQAIELDCLTRIRRTWSDRLDAMAEGDPDERRYVAYHMAKHRDRWACGFRQGWNDRLRERFASLRTENLAIPAGRDLVLTRERQLDEYFSKRPVSAARLPATWPWASTRWRLPAARWAHRASAETGTPTARRRCLLDSAVRYVGGAPNGSQPPYDRPPAPIFSEPGVGFSASSGCHRPYRASRSAPVSVFASTPNSAPTRFSMDSSASASNARSARRPLRITSTAGASTSATVPLSRSTSQADAPANVGCVTSTCRPRSLYVRLSPSSAAASPSALTGRRPP